MTKEELEREAGKWLCNNLHSASEEDFIKAMVDIAEPREKQIQIDAEQIRALQKQNGELTDKVQELEAQIEKMKCCAKCAHCNTYITSCIPQKRFVRLEDVCEDFELRR